MLIATVRTWVRQLINDQARIDGHNVFTYETSSVFKLSEDFIDEDSIIVYKNGDTLIEADWVFNTDTNQITVDIQASGEDLEENDILEVSYSYYAQYSDNEIDGFISASLLYFTEFRHKKTFEIDETDILVVEGDDVTTEEGHIIALVTAIHINPANVDLRTPDLTRSAEQNKSKKDQIAETITRWQRYIGKLSFLNETDCDC